MSTEAQIAANRENATHSTGPTSTQGKATVAENRVRHGLAGNFRLLNWEDGDQFRQLVESLYAEHQPTTATESRLVESIGQHFWLMHRALTLQDGLLATSDDPDPKAFALYLRYQTTNERAYYKAMRELATLRKEARREQIGFESQKRQAAEQARQQEAHEAKVRLTNARASATELDTDVRGTMDAPMPGEASVRFEEMSNIFRYVLRNLNQEFAAEVNNQKAA